MVQRLSQQAHQEHKISLSIKELADRYDEWMFKYKHTKTEKQELVDWLYCDMGAHYVKNYRHFCEIAAELHERGRNINPPPTELEYNLGVQEYNRGYKSHLKLRTQSSTKKIDAKLEEDKNVDISHYLKLSKTPLKPVSSLWYRVGGNFYENVLGSSSLDRLIRFRNTTRTSIIKEIEVYRYVNKKKGLLLCLKTSPFRHYELLQACKELLSPNDYEVRDYEINIKFNSTSSFNKVIKLFEHLNKKNTYIELPTEILTEITQISDTLHYSGKSHQHIVSERELLKTHVNPARTDSLALIRLLNEIKTSN